MGRTADAIADGVAIATAAARLAVKNRILVDTIADDGAFEIDEYLADARTALNDLADESEAGAEMALQARKRARGRFSDPHGTHDYRDRDKRNLRRRERQARAVALKLRQMTENDAGLRKLVEDAREAAWSEVRGNLDRRLRAAAMRPDQEPGYAEKREKRMQELRLIDLPALSAKTRQQREAEAAE